MVVLDALTKERARKAVQIVARHCQVQAAYVFGSHAERRADQSSDIDIAVFMEGLDDWDLRKKARVSALVQKEAGDDVEVHFLPARLLMHAEPASLAALVLRQGIPIT